MTSKVNKYIRNNKSKLTDKSEKNEPDLTLTLTYSSAYVETPP